MRINVHRLFVCLAALNVVGVCFVKGQRNIFVKWAPHQQHTGQTSCGPGESPCGSLSSALEQTNQSPNEDAKTTLVLLANKTSGCRIPIGGQLLISGRTHVHITLVVDADRPNTSSCSHAYLVDEEAPQSAASINVSWSTNISFENIAFRLENRSGVAIHVENSTFVVFKNCLFESTQLVPAMDLLDCKMVLIDGCRFFGPEKRPPLINNTWLEDAKPVVNIIFTVNNSESDAFLDVWNDTTADNSSISELKAENQCVSMTFQAECKKLADVLIRRSEFDHLGPMYYIVNMLRLSTDELSGAAVLVNFTASAENYLVEINATFNATWSPRDSALFIGHGGSRNMVHVHDSLFVDGWGFLGAAMFVRVYEDCDTTKENSVHVERTDFIRNTARQEGAAVLVRFEGRHRTTQQTNCAIFENCNFVDNEARDPFEFEIFKPGALLVLAERRVLDFPEKKIDTGPLRNCRKPTDLHNCKFVENKVFGAFYGRNAVAIFSGNNTFDVNKGSGVVAMESDITYTGAIVFTNNSSPSRGGAIQVAEFGQMDFRNTSTFTLSGNTAVQGRAIFVDSDSSSPPLDHLLFLTHTHREPQDCGVNMNEPLNSKFFEDMFAIGRSRLEEESVFLGSLFACFNVMDPTQSLNDPTLPEMLQKPYCMPYSKADWRYTDCNDSVEEINNTQSWNESFMCHSECQNITVLNKLNIFQRRLATLPAWIYFNSTTADCFKTVNDSEVWYFSGGCSRADIVDYAMNHTEHLLKTECALARLAFQYHRYRASVSPVLPGYRLILTPWACIVQAWNTLRKMIDSFQAGVNMSGLIGSEFHKEIPDRNTTLAFKIEPACTPLTGDDTLPVHSMSELTLYPAPGEEFEIEINVVDELMSLAEVTVGVQAVSKKGDVLLGQNGRWYAEDERIYFSSERPLWGLSLAGLPGSEGFIQVSVYKTNMRQARGDFLNLQINFRLRQCHLGFLKPTVENRNKAKEVVQCFNNWWKSQYDRVRSPYLSFHDKSNCSELKGLLCRCPEHEDGVSNCKGGRNITIKSGYWAGSLEHNNIPEPPDKPKNESFTKEKFFGLNGLSQPHAAEKFGVVPCENGKCVQSGEWQLSTDSPCIESLHTTGPLCGLCKNETSLILTSMNCEHCNNRYRLPLVGYFLALVAATALLFIFLLLVNIRVTVTLDSWLFFIQAVSHVLPHNRFLHLFFSNVLTFGLGNLCLKENINVLQAMAIFLVQPILLLLFVLVFSFAARTVVCSKLLQRVQQRGSLLHVLWLVILCSYSLIVFAAFNVLNCIKLGGEYVLFGDGSIKCFGLYHLPYAVMAITLLIGFAGFLPLLLFWQSIRVSPRLKGFMDETTHVYEDNRRWWCSVNLLRRFLFASLAAATTDSETRQMWMVIGAVLLLGLHSSFRPLRRNIRLWKFTDIDNHFETLLLVILAILALIKATALERVHRADVGASLLQKAQTPLYIVGTVLALCLSLAYAIYYRKEKMQRSVRYEAYKGDVIVDPGAKNQGSPLSGSLTGSKNHSEARFKTTNSKDSNQGLRDPLLYTELVRRSCSDLSDMKS